MPEHLVSMVDGVSVVTAALAAIEAGPDVVDFALRERKTTLDELSAAFEATKRWRGSIDRRRLVEESSDNPWSAAERQLHRMLRDAGLANWRGNWPSGDHTVEIAFVEQRLALEVDGRQFHGEANFDLPRTSDRDRAPRLGTDRRPALMARDCQEPLTAG